jgi:hypothetical protein
MFMDLFLKEKYEIYDKFWNFQGKSGEWNRKESTSVNLTTDKGGEFTSR